MWVTKPKWSISRIEFKGKELASNTIQAHKLKPFDQDDRFDFIEVQQHSSPRFEDTTISQSMALIKLVSIFKGNFEQKSKEHQVKG